LRERFKYFACWIKGYKTGVKSMVDFDGGELETLAAANTLTMPINAAIVKYLIDSGRATVPEIAEALDLDENTTGFCLLKLLKPGLVRCEYRLNPEKPSAEMVFEKTQKVYDALPAAGEYFPG